MPREARAAEEPAVDSRFPILERSRLAPRHMPDRCRSGRLHFSPDAMALQCGRNHRTGTANGLGFGFVQLQAENAATRDAVRNARDTAQTIIRFEACPRECPARQVSDNTPINVQVLRGAARPKRKLFVLWLFVIPIVIPYWQAQASADWDLEILCDRPEVQP